MNSLITISKTIAAVPAFLAGADERGLLNLKGHRSVGGMRASIYNAVDINAINALVAYMAEFEKEHG